MGHRGRVDTAECVRRVVAVVALTGTAAGVARDLAGGLAAALTRPPGHGPVELLVIPGTEAPRPVRGVSPRAGGLSAVLDKERDAELVVSGLPPRDLPRLRVLCPETVAVLVIPPSLPAAQAAGRLLDQSALWARRTILVPQLPTPAMARAVLHITAGSAAAAVPLSGSGRSPRSGRTAGRLARIVRTLPEPTWPVRPAPSPTLDEELLSCTA